MHICANIYLSQLVLHHLFPSPPSPYIITPFAQKALPNASNPGPPSSKQGLAPQQLRQQDTRESNNYHSMGEQNQEVRTYTTIICSISKPLQLPLVLLLKYHYFKIQYPLNTPSLFLTFSTYPLTRCEYGWAGEKACLCTKPY